MDRRPRVLVVDDEADIRTIVGLNLGLAGMEFGEASNGAEAIEALATGDWDACVLDLSMPDTDGFSVLRAMKEGEIDGDMLVVVLSALTSPTTALEALKLGAQAHLTKPFSPAAVAQLIQELMEMTPEQRRERRAQMIERAGMLDRLGVGTV